MAKLFASSASNLPQLFRPQHRHHRCESIPLISTSTANSLFQVPDLCFAASKDRYSSFSSMATARENVKSAGVPTSVPVRVAYELLQAGHRYLDVRTPEEFSAGHAVGAVNVPYMFRVGSGMTKNPDFLDEVLAHYRKDDEIIVGCQVGKRSLMAATDLVSSVQSTINRRLLPPPLVAAIVICSILLVIRLFNPSGTISSIQQSPSVCSTKITNAVEHHLFTIAAEHRLFAIATGFTITAIVRLSICAPQGRRHRTFSLFVALSLFYHFQIGGHR